MFKKKKSRIVVQPVEDKPALNPTPKEFVGINSIEVESQYKNFVLGVIVDYNGIEYDFEWDLAKNRLAKISAMELDPVFIQLAIVELGKFFMPKPKPEPKPVVRESPVSVPVIEKIVESVVEEIIPQPKPEPRPVTIEEDAFASDDDLAAHAERMLQTLVTGEDLGVEYMEL